MKNITTVILTVLFHMTINTAFSQTAYEYCLCNTSDISINNSSFCNRFIQNIQFWQKSLIDEDRGYVTFLKSSLKSAKYFEREYHQALEKSKRSKTVISEPNLEAEIVYSKVRLKIYKVILRSI